MNSKQHRQLVEIFKFSEQARAASNDARAAIDMDEQETAMENAFDAMAFAIEHMAHLLHEYLIEQPETEPAPPLVLDDLAELADAARSEQPSPIAIENAVARMTGKARVK